MILDPIITLDQLTAVGLTVADVDEHCPGATKYTDLSGRPCWLAADLAPLLAKESNQ